MADQENRGLVPFNKSTDISAYEDRILSPNQNTDLEQITKGYLREHKLLKNITNIRAGVGVVFACIEEELTTKDKRAHLKPEDNFKLLYKKGMDKRKLLLTKVAYDLELIGSGGEYSGELALPDYIVRPALEEYTNHILKPRLDKSKALLDEAQKRRPIYSGLLNLARTEVEKVIPQASQISLNRTQEAGLVRNTIFSYLVYGSPKPLLETEDILKNTGTFQYQTENSLQDKCFEISEVLEMDPAEVYKYLHDVTEQMKSSFSQLPNNKSSSMEGLSQSFRLLNRYFLIENPFNKFSEVNEEKTEDPHSIWNRNNTITIMTDEGVEYRVPTIKVLQVAQHAIGARDDNRASQLRRGIQIIERLHEELYDQQEKEHLKKLENNLVKEQNKSEDFRNQLYEGVIPEEAALTKNEIRKAVKEQLDSLRDEANVFDEIRSYREKQVQTAYRLLHRYKFGRQAGELDIPALLEVYEAPENINNLVRFFTREKLFRRFHDAMRFNYSQYLKSGEKQKEKHPRKNESIRNFYKDAYDTTIIDILQSRSDLWREKSIKKIPKERHLLIWDEVIQGEEDIIFSLLKLWEYQIGPNDNLAWVEQNRSLMNIHHYSELEARINKVSVWKSILANKEIPDRKRSEFMMVQSRETDLFRLKDLIDSWKKNTETSAFLRNAHSRIQIRLLSRFHKMKDAQEDKVPPFFRQMSQDFGPAMILLKSIVRLIPSGMPFKLQKIPSLEDIVNDPDLIPTQIKFKKKPSSKVEIAETRDSVKKLFKQSLAERGLVFSDNLFDHLLSVDNIHAMAVNVNLLTSFFGVEDEIKIWLQHLEMKVTEQVELPYNLLKTPPEELIKKHFSGVIKAEQSIVKAKEKRRKTIESRITQLRHLNLIVPESHFEDKSIK